MMTMRANPALVSVQRGHVDIRYMQAHYLPKFGVKAALNRGSDCSVLGHRGVCAANRPWHESYDWNLRERATM